MTTHPRQHAAPQHTLRQHSALPRLFALYVTGKIAETSWTDMMNAIDEGVETPEEREGLAKYFADACAETGAEAMKVPALHEIQALLGAMRAN
ncbi:MAG: hypothetical protein SH809_16680 [Rhodothermales bacterium]|nr:hypothetical protein [Rhodothermales bacterium]